MNSPGAGRLGSPAFTFLELLLVLMIVSVAASLAFPKISGSYNQAKWEKHRGAFEKFVRHADRLARLEGRPFLLSWNEGRCAFVLSRIGRVPPGAPGYEALLVLPGGLSGPRIDRESFLDFAELEPSRRGIDRASESGDVASLPIGGEMEVRTENFPVLFRPSGESGGASVHFRNLYGQTAWFEIQVITERSSWTNL